MEVTLRFRQRQYAAISLSEISCDYLSDMTLLVQTVHCTHTRSGVAYNRDVLEAYKLHVPA